MSAQHAQAARARWKDATKAERVAGTAAMRQAAAVRRAKADALLAAAEAVLGGELGFVRTPGADDPAGSLSGPQRG